MNEEFMRMYGDAFANCIVVNKQIMFLQSFSEQDMKKIYAKFCEDLYDYGIPHYRVVGIHWHEEIGENSVFRINRNYQQSIIELSIKAQDIIPDALGGNDMEKGCFTEKGVKIKSKTSVNLVFGDVLKAPLSQVGQLMHVRLDESFHGTPWIQADSLQYCQFSLPDDDNDIVLQAPNFLYEGFNLGRTQGHAFSIFQTTFFYMEGTGVHDFDDNQKLFARDKGVFPCRTVYDLSKFFFCKPVFNLGNALSLVYNYSVNETVLTTILRKYGKELISE